MIKVNYDINTNKVIGFDKNIEPRCEYCEKGYLSSDGKNVLCKKKGVVEKGFSCLSFTYDPLLRKPKPISPEIQQFNPEDFKIWKRYFP